MKRCVTCHQDKPFEDFARRTSSADGRQARCRGCYREWYAAHQESARAAIDQHRRDTRADIQQRLIAYLLANPCVDCGESDVRVLELDHRDATTKKVGIAAMMTGAWGWRAVQAEIAKCDVRCANCHRRITAARASQWRHLWWITQHPDVDVTARLERLLPSA